MTSANVPAPVRAVTRRRLAILLPLGVGLVVGAILWRAGERRAATTPPPGPTVIEHVYTYEPAPPEPPPPMPAADAWAGLERCLREDPHLASLEPPITVADVRRWVEVEHDRTWVEDGVWWLPMSGEGSRQVPSGYYVGVPPAATAPCRGAIINSGSFDSASLALGLAQDERGGSLAQDERGPISRSTTTALTRRTIVARPARAQDVIERTGW